MTSRGPFLRLVLNLNKQHHEHARQRLQWSWTTKKGRTRATERQLRDLNWNCFINVENKEALVEERNLAEKNDGWKRKWNVEETNPVILLMISVLVILNTLLFTFRLSVPCVISLVNVMLKNESALYSSHLFSASKLTFFSPCSWESQRIAAFGHSTCLTFFSFIYDQDLK